MDSTILDHMMRTHHVIPSIISVCFLILVISLPTDGRPNVGLPRDDATNDVMPPELMLNFTYNEWQQRRIESIKREILDKLGMSHIPDVSNVSTSVEEHREILRKYKRSLHELHGKIFTQLYDQLHYANTFDAFTDTGDKPLSVDDAMWQTGDKVRVYFSVNIPEPTDAREETIVTSAVMKLYKQTVHPDRVLSDNIIASSIRVNVYQIIHIQTEERRLIDSRLVSLSQAASWEEFDVSQAVQDWIRDPTTNLGLEITSTAALRHPLRRYVEFMTSHGIVSEMSTRLSWPVTDDNELLLSPSSDTLPTLSVLTQHRPILGSGATPAGRTRRDTRDSTFLPHLESGRSNCLPSDNEERCCRYPLTVSFRDIGWHSWIIQPESYEAYYCYGSCPPGHRITHNFGTVKSIMLEINRNSVLSLKCAATRVGPLNIAHYNSEGRLVINVFENMVTEECSCI